MEYLIFEIGIVVIASSLVGLILLNLKQPLILAYILAGILIGPAGLGIIHDAEFIHGISNVGIIFMLFLIGLEMNTSRLKDLGLVSLVAGAGQVLFTGLTGFAIVKLFGFTNIQSIYLAIALTFSSTVIAVKLLSDKRDTKSFYGQICIGILIVQDVLAIFALLLLAGFKEGSFTFDYIHFIDILSKGLILTVIVLFFSKRILKFIYNKIADSHELLVLFSLSWCFLISLLSIEIGFSMEIGAFLAGISLANLPYTFEINAKTKILRDFFITIFFAVLGANMMFGSIDSLIIPLVALSLFVLIGNPIIILIIMGIMGYDKRTSFFTGLNIANISEFSLIVIALGMSLGHLDDTIVSMVTIIAMITMVMSSYMITYNAKLYSRLKKYLTVFEKKKHKKASKQKQKISDHIILIGCGHLGEQVLEQILGLKEDYVVLDHDNKVVTDLIEKKVNCVYGDVEDEDLLDELDVEDAEVIISTIPNTEDLYFLLQRINEMKSQKKPILIILANSGREGISLLNQGVDYVVMKDYLGAQHIQQINEKLFNIPSDHQHVPISNVIAHHKDPDTGEIVHIEDEHDLEIVKIVHNLNQSNLKTIKKERKKKLNPIKQTKASK